MVHQDARRGVLPRQGGAAILNAIVGSLYLAGGATLLAILVSLPVALYLNCLFPPLTPSSSPSAASLRRSQRRSLHRLRAAFRLQPPYDLFRMRASLLEASSPSPCSSLPMLIRSMDEVIRLCPRELLDASYALGATRWETALKVVVRQSLPGILTAILIAFGRGIATPRPSSSPPLHRLHPQFPAAPGRHRCRWPSSFSLGCRSRGPGPRLCLGR